MAFTPYGYGPQPMYGGYMPPMPDQLAQLRAQQMPQQPQGSPIWVQGEGGAKSYLVAPGQSLILMDSEAEVFYIKSTDASGVPLPLRTFDYKERSTGAQRPTQAAQMQPEQYVTRAEFDALAAKIAAMTQPVHAEPMRRRRQETEGEIDA